MHLRRTVLALTLLSATAVAASAQSPAEFRDQIAGHFSSSMGKVVALAEAMPGDTYSWSPSEGVASVVSVYMHIARYNYMYLAENMGVDSPVSAAEYGRWEDEVTDKAEALRIARASMEHVRSTIAGMSDADMQEATRLYGRGVGKWAVLLQLVAHMNEHLGQSIAYARMNGVVPPWSS